MFDIFVIKWLFLYRKLSMYIFGYSSSHGISIYIFDHVAILFMYVITGFTTSDCIILISHAKTNI